MWCLFEQAQLAVWGWAGSQGTSTALSAAVPARTLLTWASLNPGARPAHRKVCVLLTHLGGHSQVMRVLSSFMHQILNGLCLTSLLWCYCEILSCSRRKPEETCCLIISTCVHSEETNPNIHLIKKIWSYDQTEIKVVLAGIRQRRLYLKLISRDTGSNVRVNTIIYFIGLPSAMMLIK